MKETDVFLCILLWFCGCILQGRALVVSRGRLDVFNNPNVTTCERNERYCKDRRAVCFGADCCRCKCELEYSTFHSPGVSYEFKDGKPSYTFDGEDTCVWNHYAHEGCRFIEESPSTSSRRFVPLINLSENGTLNLKVSLNGVDQCNQFRLFTKRPKEHDWVELERDAVIFSTSWKVLTDIILTLQWHDQGAKFGGLMLKLNFTCDSAVEEKREPCIILKIKGTYDTQTNISIGQIPTEGPTTASTPGTETTTSPPTTTTTRSVLLFGTKIISIITEPAVKAVVATNKKSTPKTKMVPTNKTKAVSEANKANDNTEGRGETFWVLVYVFMAFAIFEILCVALFFIYKHRRKRKQRDITTNETTSNYDNHGMQEARASTISPAPGYPETIELYENEMEPRYSSIQQVQSSMKNNNITVIENGIPTLIVPEQRSRQNSHISQARSIIVLPKDCVIVHASGSRKSRNSRRSAHGEGSTHEECITHDIEIPNHAGPKSDDTRSLSSWESFSSCYRTSTDEDYVSGSNRIPWEEDSLYEEPDKVIQKGKSTFGLERLFALQESVLNTGNYANEDSDDTIADTKQENVDHEHIYETAEAALSRDRSLSYYENAYDLPEDALAKCLGKPNKYALKHVLHEDNTDDHEDRPSLNLGMEFVNNNEVTEEGEDLKLRPTRRSTLYLHQVEDESNNKASVC